MKNILEVLQTEVQRLMPPNSTDESYKKAIQDVLSIVDRMMRLNAGRTTEYVTWVNIKQRCLNPKYKEYKYFGGRGIKMQESWINSFMQFIIDVGEKPVSDGKKYALNRVDSDGNYCKENCQWVAISGKDKK